MVCSLHIVLFLLFLSSSTLGSRQKRLLPNNQECDPTSETCLKGDLIDTNIADCQFQRTASHLISCTAEGNSGGFISWVVAPEKYGLCQPVKSGVKFECGSVGTNTRCVCSDYKVKWNSCRCQYWTESTPGEHKPAFCTAHYLGGDSGVHHYSCCNNCNDSNSTKLPSCDGQTYEGGSTGSYCGSCGKPTGGGVLKWYFNCMNCSVQSQCQAICNKKVSTKAGFCWKWIDCFKGCCSEASKSLYDPLWMISDTDSFGFCGDAICQSSENHFSCPTDCCYQINSTCLTGATCSPSCCEEITCCSNL